MLYFHTCPTCTYETLFIVTLLSLPDWIDPDCAWIDPECHGSFLIANGSVQIEHGSVQIEHGSFQYVFMKPFLGGFLPEQFPGEPKWTQPYIYIYAGYKYIYGERQRERERERLRDTEKSRYR